MDPPIHLLRMLLHILGGSLEKKNQAKLCMYFSKAELCEMSAILVSPLTDAGPNLA